MVASSGYRIIDRLAISRREKGPIDEDGDTLNELNVQNHLAISCHSIVGAEEVFHVYQGGARDCLLE